MDADERTSKEYYVEEENVAIKSSLIEYFVQKFDRSKRGPAPHIHPAVEILHIKEGRFEVWVDEKKYELSPGETVLIRSNAIHRTDAIGESGVYLVLKFKPDFLMQLASSNRVSAYLLSLSLTGKENKTVWDAGESEKISAVFDELFRESRIGGYGADMAVKLCVGRIALEILRSVGAPGAAERDSKNLLRRIYDATVIINAEYSQNLTLSDCASRVFLSDSYFSRSFRRITGKTFKEYLNQIRINRAQMMLLSGDMPITRVCADCGFNNLAYFCAVYRRLKGVTPGEDRNRGLA
ncbi:MAG: helix-turn-helix domain-containing protein [Clostridia bacterium]|nr:helix-turn-helix domain-containing protein [Clostridia bacterium]